MQTQTHLQFNDVEPYQQIQPYSCGAAVLKAVMGHWGEDADERALIREIGVDPETGSTCYQVEAAARRRGYFAQTIQFNSIDELEQYTSRDVPVILAIQSFTRPGQGHFVVATDVEPDDVEIMDPNVNGNQRRLSRRELDKRWKFRDRVGVLVLPRDARGQLGQPNTSSRRFNWVGWLPIFILGGLIAAATTGVVIYRRKQRSQS